MWKSHLSIQKNKLLSHEQSRDLLWPPVAIHLFYYCLDVKYSWVSFHAGMCTPDKHQESKAYPYEDWRKCSGLREHNSSPCRGQWVFTEGNRSKVNVLISFLFWKNTFIFEKKKEKQVKVISNSLSLVEDWYSRSLKYAVFDYLELLRKVYHTNYPKKQGGSPFKSNPLQAKVLL